jgi:hypothetical protein
MSQEDLGPSESMLPTAPVEPGSAPMPHPPALTEPVSAPHGETAPGGGIMVFAPTLLLTVTLEVGPGEQDELHLHAGGQGFWVARMIRRLGLRATFRGGGTPCRKLAEHLLGAAAARGREVDPPAPMGRAGRR